MLFSRLTVFAAEDTRHYIPLTQSQGITQVLTGTVDENGVFHVADEVLYVPGRSPLLAAPLRPIDKHIKFCDYAEYVLDLKERTGLSPTTIERYRSMLPRIFDGIGHLKVGDIRPFHLNDFYKHLDMGNNRSFRGNLTQFANYKILEELVKFLVIFLLVLIFLWQTRFFQVYFLRIQ